MRSNIVASFQVGVLFTSVVACSAAGPDGAEEALDDTTQAATSCPLPSALDDQMRAAATVALSLMKDAALWSATQQWPSQSFSVLAPQRYRIQASGTGIEFDPTDTLYNTVTDAMKAHLAFAQLDASVAKFLSDGLRYAYANTDGQTFPRIITIPALAKFTYPGPLTSVKVQDSTSSNDSHRATISGHAWCGTAVVKIADTVQNSWQYSPLFADNITLWRGSVPSGFKGKSHNPWTPFNGARASGNPYLIVSVNGKSANWATYDFKPAYCYDFPNFTCSGSLEIDPVPYAEPGEYYTTAGAMGTQSNPFPLSSTVLYAVPEHASQWATKVVNGVQEWGVFSKPMTLYGTTMYRYVKQM